MAIKKFKTYQQQIELLKSKQLIINDEIWAFRMLTCENYYSVINGYKDFFIDKRYKKERYKKDVTIEEIYELYLFDRDLRMILLKYILIVESTLRSLIAYNFSMVHGHDNYLKFSNFDSLKNVSTKKDTLELQASRIHSLISKLQEDISKTIEKKEYMNHYVVEYGYVPLWVLVNTMSLGELSSFYELMIPNERIAIAKHWSINEGYLREYINNLTFFRNICAHGERLYNVRTHKGKNKNHTNIPDNIYHSRLNIVKSKEGVYTKGKNDLFSLIIVLKLLLDDKEFCTLINKVEGLNNRLKMKMTSTNYQDVIEIMGFPYNWKKNIK